MIETVPRETKIHGGTLKWMGVTIFRAWKAIPLTLISILALTSPVVLFLFISYILIPESQFLRYSIISYGVFSGLIGITAAGVLREVEIKPNWSEIGTAVPGSIGRQSNEPSMFDLLTLLIFLLGGISIFTIITILIAAGSSILIGVWGTVIIPFSAVKFEEYLNQKHGKSVIATIIKRIQYVYETLGFLTVSQRTRVDELSQMARLLIVTMNIRDEETLERIIYG